MGGAIAATVLYERLQKLQTANVGSTDPNARTVTDAYLALINVLSCVDEDQAWILSTQREEAEPTAATGAKRARLESGLLPCMRLGIRGMAANEMEQARIK